MGAEDLDDRSGACIPQSKCFQSAPCLLLHFLSRYTDFLLGSYELSLMSRTGIDDPAMCLPDDHQVDTTASNEAEQCWQAKFVVHLGNYMPIIEHFLNKMIYGSLHL